LSRFVGRHDRERPPDGPQERFLRKSTHSWSRGFVADLGLLVDLSTSALIGGVLRDSATLYPLRNATILLTLPGVVDFGDDACRRLVPDDCRPGRPRLLPVVVTPSRPDTRQAAHNPWSIKASRRSRKSLVKVDVASTVAQILGQVLDSQSNFPISRATVTVFSSLLTDSVYTSPAGHFRLNKPCRVPVNFGIPHDRQSRLPPGIVQFTASADRRSPAPSCSSATRRRHPGFKRDRQRALISSSACRRTRSSVYGVGGTESTVSPGGQDLSGSRSTSIIAYGRILDQRSSRRTRRLCLACASHDKTRRAEFPPP